MQISKISTQSFNGWYDRDKSIKKVLSESIVTLPEEKRVEAIKVVEELDKFTPNHELMAAKTPILNKLELSANLYGMPDIVVKQGVFKNKDALTTLQNFRDRVMSAERSLGGDIDFIAAYKDGEVSI